MKLEEAKAKAAIEKTFGSFLSFQDIAAAAQNVFPREVQDLQALGVFFEGEMLRCRDAKTYFSGCLAAAAMIESCLLLFSLLDRAEVKRTAVFKKLSKPTKTYEESVLRWTLKELIPVAEELNWIRHSIQPSAIKVLIKLHEELAPAARPGITPQEIVAGTRYIETHADLALLHLTQSMRNLIHGGRCVRLRKKLDTADFAEWAQLVMVLTVEIRDCLILRLKDVSRQYLADVLSSPEGKSAVMKIVTSMLSKAAAKSAAPGLN